MVVMVHDVMMVVVMFGMVVLLVVMMVMVLMMANDGIDYGDLGIVEVTPY